jgi:hypothetical protein
LIQVCGFNEALNGGFVLSESRIDQANIGENLGGISNTL